MFYLLERDRDLVRTTTIDRYLPLRGPPGRIPSAWQPPWSSQTLTASTDNTILIQSLVRGFVLSPGRGRAKAETNGSAVHKRPACPCGDTATCPASRSSSSVRALIPRPLGTRSSDGRRGGMCVHGWARRGECVCSSSGGVKRARGGRSIHFLRAALSERAYR